MLLNSALNRYKIKQNELKDWIKNILEKDYQDLSETTKEIYKEKYELLLESIINQNSIKQVI